MKRFLLLFLLLALLLSLTGCFTITGDTTDTSPEGKQEEPEEQHLTADVDETQVWQRTTGAPWTGGEPQTVSADFERISGAAAQGMTVGQELLLLDFMDCYYQSVADLRVIDPAVLFADSEETLYHKNIWHGLCVIREALAHRPDHDLIQLLPPVRIHYTLRGDRGRRGPGAPGE